MQPGIKQLPSKKPDWDELKKTGPPNTPKPPDSLLVAASLVFKASNGPVDLKDYRRWWNWVKGADWKHPEGPGSSIEGEEMIFRDAGKLG